MFTRRKSIFYKKESRAKILLGKIDYLWLYTIFIIWGKSLFFLALLHGKNSATLNISRMYFSPPPVISHILFIVALLSFGFFMSNNWRKGYFVLCNILVSLLIWMDLLYFRAYGAFLSISFLINKGTFNPLNKSLMSYVHLIDLVFFLDIIFVVAIIITFRNYSKESKTNILAFIITFVISVSYISFDHYWIDIKDATKGTMLFFRVCWAPFQTMSNMSPLGYHLYDSYLNLTENKPITLSKEQTTTIENWFDKNKESLEDNEYKGILKGKNVIFLQVESLETFVIGEKAGGEDITPNINEILNNSLFFSNVYEQVNNGTSSDGDLITNTSVFPIREGSTFFKYPNTHYRSLPVILGEQGYNTLSTHPENGGNWNWIHAHKALGFQDSWDVNKYDLSDKIGPGLSDKSLFQQFSEFVSKEKQPFYAHVVTLTSHGPFDIPKEEQKMNLDGSLKNNILGDYFQSINYVDRQIGNFIKELKEKDLLKDTVLVIYGDHTGVHKFYENQLSKLQVEKPQWLEKDLRVPFIIYNEDIAGKEFNLYGGQTDIVPTIAYLLGIDRAEIEKSFMGKILVNTNKNYTLLNNGQVIGEFSPEEKDHLQQAFKVSDLIIKGNYFKDSQK